MTIKECIDIVDNVKPNQYSIKEKVMWLSFIDETIINDVLKTHEGYDGRYDEFTGYTEDKLSVTLIVPSPYDRLYTAYLKMKIDGENGEASRYNNSAALFNSYYMEYRKYYNKTHVPISITDTRPAPKTNNKTGISEAEYENLKRDLFYKLSEHFASMTSHDKIYDAVTNFVNNNLEMLKGEKSNSSSKLSYVTLAASRWVGESSPYSQVVTISGTTKNSKIDLNPTVEQLSIFHSKDLAFVVGNNNGNITVYCIGQKPTNDYKMQVTITEVAVNG